MNIITLGSRTQLSQIDRIEAGLIALGHTINSPSSPIDFIYCNDAENFDKGIELKAKHGVHLILNILDLPYFLPNFDEIVKKISGQISRADTVTCISQTVKSQIKQYLGVEAAVIYNPVKDVYPLNFKRHIPFFYCGRARDSMKRFGWVMQALQMAGVAESELVVAGPENPGFGKYIGVVSDEQLNYLYNSSKYLIYPSVFDGLGLPPIEFTITGGVPIVCSDSLVSSEFFPRQVICEPHPESIVQKLKEVGQDYKTFQSYMRPYKEILGRILNKEQVASRIIQLTPTYPTELCRRLKYS